MSIKIIPLLEDNYSYLLMHGKNAIVIDPSQSEPILEALENENLHLSHILLTHHHNDHIGGVSALKEATQCKILAPNDRRIQNIDIPLSSNKTFIIGPYEIKPIHTPGHTKTHTVYYLHTEKLLFSGDALFSAGCGRLFEGSYEEMLFSLETLKALPDETKIYFGHEYTLKNLRFAQSLERENIDIKKSIFRVQNMRCTAPSTIALEKVINPFFRLESLKIQDETTLDASSISDN